MLNVVPFFGSLSTSCLGRVIPESPDCHVWGSPAGFCRYLVAEKKGFDARRRGFWGRDSIAPEI